MTRDWFVIVTLPIPGFVSVVSLAVFGLTGDGIQLAPGFPESVSLNEGKRLKE